MPLQDSNQKSQQTRGHRPTPQTTRLMGPAGPTFKEKYKVNEEECLRKRSDVWQVPSQVTEDLEG